MTVEFSLPIANAEPPVVEEPAAAPLVLIEQLVRDPGAFAESPGEGDVAARARVLLATVLFGAGAFGVVLGAHRGALQALYCAIKLPLVLMVTLAVCAPAFVGIARATGTRVTARAMVELELGACARLALVLAGLGPVVWLVQGWFQYHGVILVATAVCAAAGIAGASVLFRGLARVPGRGTLAGIAAVALFALVGSHTAWLMRPFVLRPRAQQVVFVRHVEGDMLDALTRNTRSAAGIYDVERAASRGRDTESESHARDCAAGEECE